MKASHFWPLTSLFLRFAEVQGKRARLPLDKLQKSLGSFMDPCKETHAHHFSIVMDFHHQLFNNPDLVVSIPVFHFSLLSDLTSPENY